MSRDINDPRIVEVIRVFHRHVASTQTQDAAEQAEQYVSAILMDGYSHEDAFTGFPTPGLVALLMAYLQYAPEAALDSSVAIARAQLASLLDFELPESQRTDFDYPTQLAQELELIRAAREATVR